MLAPTARGPQDEVARFVERRRLAPHVADGMRRARTLIMGRDEQAIRYAHIDNAIRRHRTTGASEEQLNNLAEMGRLWIALQREQTSYSRVLRRPTPPPPGLPQPVAIPQPMPSIPVQPPPPAQTFSPTAHAVLMFSGIASIVMGALMLTGGIAGIRFLVIAVIGGVGLIGIAQRYRKDHEAELRMQACAAKYVGRVPSGF